MKKKFLLFVTGVDRLPAVHVGELSFVLSDGGSAGDRLPEAHTCFNMLVLYRYPNRQVMEDKLMNAIQNAEGFDLK